MQAKDATLPRVASPSTAQAPSTSLALPRILRPSKTAGWAGRLKGKKSRTTTLERSLWSGTWPMQGSASRTPSPAHLLGMSRCSLATLGSAQVACSTHSSVAGCASCLGSVTSRGPQNVAAAHLSLGPGREAQQRDGVQPTCSLTEKRTMVLWPGQRRPSPHRVWRTGGWLGQSTAAPGTREAGKQGTVALGGSAKATPN